VKLERGAGEIPTLRVIRQKLGLFNDPLCMNRDALFHSITIDAASFQGEFLERFPSTCKLFDAMIQSFNVWFQVRALVQQAESEMRARAAAVQDDTPCDLDGIAGVTRQIAGVAGHPGAWTNS
jgi:hypothetical protein